MNPKIAAGAALYIAAAGIAYSAEATMRAMVPEAGSGSLSLRVVARPEPGAGEVRVRVRAAGVNPIDWKMLSGTAGAGRGGPPPKAGAPRGGEAPGRDRGSMSNPAGIPGFDAAGEIDALGAGVSRWRIGDAVIVFSDARGAYAEYLVAPESAIAAKPDRMSFEEAAGIPTVGYAAWNMVAEVAGIQQGQRVLVQGGAGGVGSAVVQLAKARGAYIAATALGRDQEYLRSIGVDVPIDYTQERFEDRVQDYDAVINTVDDAETIRRSVKVLRRGGIFASVTGQPAEGECASAGIRCSGRTMGLPAGEVIREVGELVQAGKYRVHVFRSFPLAEAEKALELSKEGQARGKIILRVPE